MPANYQKLYTYVVGKVDDAIKLIDLIGVSGNSTEMISALIKDSLVQTLQTAEEMYPEATEGE